MPVDNVLSESRAWSRAIAQVAVEFGPADLEVISGSLPVTLRGTLYRNGPGRLERGGQRVGHWFDGDGGILAVQMGAGQARGRYRYVQTAGYVAEERGDRYQFGGYGMLAPGPWWNRMRRGVKHVANTAVLPLEDRLLALWEGGPPYALDQQTLATGDLDTLGGLGDRPYSAHPKRDGKTHEIFNFGMSPGAQTRLNLYRSDATGQLRRRGALALAGFPLVHDFVMAGPYLIFCIPPVRLQVLPVLLGQKSFSEAMQWQPQLGTEVVVCDRDTLAVISRTTTDPWFQWHFAQGTVLADGSVAIALVQYADWRTNQFLQEVSQGKIHTDAPGELWNLRLDPLTGKVLERSPLLSQRCEFPTIPPAQVGQPARYSYLNVQRPDNDFRELFGAIARFDHHTGGLMIADCGSQCYPGEPIYAPDAQNPEQSWILAVVYDGNLHQSQLWVFDGDRLDQAVCKLALPDVVPPGFHGAWQPAVG
jgi:all-trans-8'-apo-beta-carotenal 15,15'-oxygenase